MDSLPPELLHPILSHLSPPSLAALRLVGSRRISYLAHPYLLQGEVHVLYTTASFERLLETAEHPLHSKHITSLFLEGDTSNQAASFDDWFQRIDPYSLRDITLSNPVSFRIQKRVAQDWLRECVRCRDVRDRYAPGDRSTARGWIPLVDEELEEAGRSTANSSPGTGDSAVEKTLLRSESPSAHIEQPSLLSEADKEAVLASYFDAFQALAKDQAVLHNTWSFYLPLYRSLSSLRHTLKHVTLSVQGGAGPRTDLFHKTFAKTLTIPLCDEQQIGYNGLIQLTALLIATREAGIKLEGLNIGFVYWKLWRRASSLQDLLDSVKLDKSVFGGRTVKDMYADLGAAEGQPGTVHDLWCDQVQWCKELRIAISTGHLFNTYHHRMASFECMTTMNSRLNFNPDGSEGTRTVSPLRRFICSSRALRVLSLRFEWEDPYPCCLENIIGSRINGDKETWPKLREAEFAFVRVDRTALANFWERHASRDLRVLRMRNVGLTGNNGLNELEYSVPSIGASDWEFRIKEDNVAWHLLWFKRETSEGRRAQQEWDAEMPMKG
ncbi:hypothetical protein MMC25_006148 [Agyrium rufum]|nr:hypothetical protein [Agyrium rufum]